MMDLVFELTQSEDTAPQNTVCISLPLITCVGRAGRETNGLHFIDRSRQAFRWGSGFAGTKIAFGRAQRQNWKALDLFKDPEVEMELNVGVERSEKRVA